MENALTITDTRSNASTKFDWTVTGRLFEGDDDFTGTDVNEGFDSPQIAANFVVNSLGR